MKASLARFALLAPIFALGISNGLAWDYQGHRLVNQLALASLPPDFPAFVSTPEARERIAFLGGEPDRWRNTDDPALSNASGPDHYIDFEELAAYHLDPHTLTRFRYDFAAQLAVARAQHPENFKPIDPAMDRDHTRPLIGFLPWAILENFDKLKSQFSYLKAYQDGGGTPEELANARENIIYVMGVMGHYVGDASQPLHTTIHHHGWVGENPRGFATNSSIHGWIDGGYFQKTGGLTLEETRGLLRAAQSISTPSTNGQPNDAFGPINEYLRAQFKQVVPLYELEKSGKLSGEGDVGLQGKVFLKGQLANGAQMLANLWFTAWKESQPDRYLTRQLARRKDAQENSGGAH